MLLIAFASAVLLSINAVVFGVIVAAVLSHSLLAFLDVSYTDGRRYISPVEQLVHGYMDILPLMATALFGLLHCGQRSAPKSPGRFAQRRVLQLCNASRVNVFRH